MAAMGVMKILNESRKAQHTRIGVGAHPEVDCFTIVESENPRSNVGAEKTRLEKKPTGSFRER